jgi:PEP-CTERM motif
MGKLLRSAAFCGLMLVGLGQAEASTPTLYGSLLFDGKAALITIDPSTGAIQSADSRFIDGGDWPYATDIAFSPEASAVPEPATWALFGAGFLGLACVGIARRRLGSP